MVEVRLGPLTIQGAPHAGAQSRRPVPCGGTGNPEPSKDVGLYLDLPIATMCAVLLMKKETFCVGRSRAHVFPTFLYLLGPLQANGICDMPLYMIEDIEAYRSSYALTTIPVVLLAKLR